MRVVRAFLGILLLLAGIPALVAGGGLWLAAQHRDAAGAYTAPLEDIHTSGYAVVVSDVDGLLRREAPFVRGGQSTLRVTAQTDAGPAFVGLAPAEDVARWLAGVGYTQITGVSLTRGPLPVSTARVAGNLAPVGEPYLQPFWTASSGPHGGTMAWTPSEARGEQLALVVMDQRGRAPLTVGVTAEFLPRWLNSTTWGLLTLGTILVLFAWVALGWPSRSREVVYVVPPAELAEIAARLGLPVPAASVVRHERGVDATPPGAPARPAWPAPPPPPESLLESSPPPGPSAAPGSPAPPVPDVPDLPPPPVPEVPEVLVPGVVSAPDDAPVTPALPAGAALPPPPVRPVLMWPPVPGGRRTAAPVPVAPEPAREPATAEPSRT
jgi:hypothetical protein